jgi:hypothetical protein
MEYKYDRKGVIDNFEKIFDQVALEGDEYEFHIDGKPVAVLIPWNEYERLIKFATEPI